MPGSRSGRLTPYERVFGSERFAGVEFPAAARESEEAGLRLTSVEEFGLLPRVAHLLQEMAPEGSEPAALAAHLDLLFHAFHFWRAGLRMYAFDEGVIRFLAESELDLDDWIPAAPHAACYVELPSNIFWAAVDPELPPEPVEGAFIRIDADEPGTRIGVLDLLLVLGMRADRPGFSAVPLKGDLQEALRSEDSTAFRSELPAGRDAGLYSLRRPSEALLLVHRLLWYLDEYTRALEQVSGGGDEKGSTALEFFRVCLTDRS